MKNYSKMFGYVGNFSYLCSVLNWDSPYLFLEIRRRPLVRGGQDQREGPARQQNCRERWLLGGDEECVEGFVDFDVAGKGVVSGALAGEGVDVGEVFESFYRI